MEKISRLLIKENPLQVLPGLAVLIGLNEAIVLQQLHYWIANPKSQGIEQDGYKWVYNTYEEWQENNFPFWSVRTVQRIFLSLEKMGLVVSEQFNSKDWDRRKSYRIDYDKLDCIEHDNLARSTGTDWHYFNKNTETTTETNTENTDMKTKEQIYEEANLIVDTLIANSQRAKENPSINAINTYPEDVRQVIIAFSEKWKIQVPRRGSRLYSKWIKDARDFKMIISDSGLDYREVLDNIYKYIHTPDGSGAEEIGFEKFSVSDIGSILKTAGMIIGKMLSGQDITYVSPIITYDADGNPVVWQRK